MKLLLYQGLEVFRLSKCGDDFHFAIPPSCDAPGRSGGRVPDSRGGGLWRGLHLHGRKFFLRCRGVRLIDPARGVVVGIGNFL